MDVIIMPSTTSLVARLQIDFPQFAFSPGDDFQWTPSCATIFYGSNSSDTASLLHELGHALLGHIGYARDITLLKMEREAWEYAQTILAPKYNLTITDETIEEAVDTYRDWLHARSTCPSCSATGIQIAKQEYKCLACHKEWHVNDARNCELKRYKTAK